MSKNTEKKKKTVNPYRRALLWKILDYVFAIAPLLILVGVEWDEYFGQEYLTSVSNGIGLCLLAIFIILTLTKKSVFIKNVGSSVMLFAICFFLKAILNDLVIITGCFAIGQVLSAFITTPLRIKWEKIRDKVETAEINATYYQKVQNGEEISGRV